MNVPMLTMPADLAHEKYEQYKAALETREATAEDVEILLGYKALAAGKQLLDLRDVFRTCPLTDKGLPKLAVARASWRWCHFAVSGDFAVFASSSRFTFVSSWKPKKPRGHVRVRRSNMPAGTKGEARALVPLIPAPIRPRAADLSRYFVLFEAEWQAVPPKDPLLLSRLSGSLYVILAAWDLTELERSVLAGRFNEPNT